MIYVLLFALYLAYLMATGKKEKPVRGSPFVTTTKRCTRCNGFFQASPDWFYRSNRSRDGIKTWCIFCEREYQRNSYDPERASAYRLENRDKYLAYLRDYRNDPDIYGRLGEYQSRYRVTKAGIVKPGFLSLEEETAVREIYRESKVLNLENGPAAYHVDHIYPVSKGGEHHPDNLQILTAEENRRKGNNII